MPKNKFGGSAPPKKHRVIHGPTARSGKSHRPLPHHAPHYTKLAAPVQQPIPESFAELGLDEAVLNAISAMGFKQPTPIQGLAIPVLLTGEDLLGLAQTGTGKTAAFGLPLVQRIDPALPATQALVLAPTRELAIQVAKGLHDFSKHSDFRVVPLYGGQPIDRQLKALRNPPQIVVGTPGRVLDHIRRGTLKLDQVTFCVVDEADDMMAMGFSEDMDAILAELPYERQLAFFSATMAPRVLAITNKFLRNPRRVEIAATQRTLETTSQTYYLVPPGKKQEALARVLDMETPGSSIVFCRTRVETAELCESLRLKGYSAEPIHGDMGQSERERVLRRFREGLADLLIATDVAARGLDIEGVTHVINYDVPWDVDQYIHRVGRTGRAGRSGEAITLVYHRERRQLSNIERMIGAPIEQAPLPTQMDIVARRKERFADAIQESVEQGDNEFMADLARDLVGHYGAERVAAAALALLWKERHQQAEAQATQMRGEAPEMGMARILVGMGRHDGLRPADLVGAITNESGLSGHEIGVIQIQDRSSFVEVPASQGERVAADLARTKLRHRTVSIQLAAAGA